ncbi:unnamed protein product [Heligmosomoides polygyrus]|uniref:UBX domain-containing protein n=1 Tax=Heligmosomoides polygyrus TaxID=6339 RepID=A0A183GWE0_HELPZ|nr:unnamed protein product [Heligmosomoides polygyrus]
MGFPCEPKTLQAMTPSLHLSLEFIFIFASEHYVISIKQRPRDGLLKISCDGIHYDNKEEWGTCRTLVEMGTPLRFPLQLALYSLGKSRASAPALCVPQEISTLEFPHPAIPSVDSVHGPVHKITVEETEAALKKMKSGKVTDPDDHGNQRIKS